MNVATNTQSADQMGPFDLYIEALKSTGGDVFRLGGGSEEAGWDAGGAPLSHPASAFLFLIQTVTVN